MSRSPEITARMQQLIAKDEPYTPNQAILNEIAKKHIVLFVGPSAIGKSTLMHHINRLDRSFAYVSSFTTRPPATRDTPGLYQFFNSDDEIAQLIDMIENREVVQFAPHPTTGELYGSLLSGYSGRYDMLDMLYNKVDDMLTTGFGRVDTIALTCNADEWVTRFTTRYPVANDESKKRLTEAIDCLKWALAQPQDGIVWIDNSDGQLETAAHEVLDYVKHNHKSSTQARESARALVKTMEGMLP